MPNLTVYHFVTMDRKKNQLTSVGSEADRVGRQGGIVGWAVAVASIKLARDCALLTGAAGLGADTGGCCFFFRASCK